MHCAFKSRKDGIRNHLALERVHTHSEPERRCSNSAPKMRDVDEAAAYKRFCTTKAVESARCKVVRYVHFQLEEGFTTVEWRGKSEKGTGEQTGKALKEGANNRKRKHCRTRGEEGGSRGPGRLHCSQKSYSVLKVRQDLFQLLCQSYLLLLYSPPDPTAHGPSTVGFSEESYTSSTAMT